MTAEAGSPRCSSESGSLDSLAGSHGSNEMSIEKATKPSILPLQTKDNICTGIILLKDQMQFFKLNYPTDKSPDGGGHVMSELEIISECSHYQLKVGIESSSGNHQQFQEWTEFQQSLKPAPLMRFTKTTSVSDSYKSFDVFFPQVEEEEPLLVRARDMVRLVSEGEHRSSNSGMSLPLQEHFWAKVISVTTLGQVTAICANDLTTTNLRQGDYISFPMACVLGVVHGSHWEYKSSDDEKKKKPFQENDIQLLEMQMGCSRGRAIEALLQSRGDLTQACMRWICMDEP